MTPPATPRGSDYRSPNIEIPQPQDAPETTQDGPGMAPFQLGGEFAYLAAGDAGNPIRVGLLAQHRPHQNFSWGLHLDTNLQDEFLLNLRGEGRIPIHPIFEAYGAAEAGVRALLGQNHIFETEAEPQGVSGALFNFGAEIGGRFYVEDAFFDVFTRFLYSPPSGVSLTGMMEEGVGSAPVGTQLDGFEWSIGVRVGINLPPGSQSSSIEEDEIENQAEEPEPVHTGETRRALSEFSESLDNLIVQAQELEAAAHTEESSEETEPSSHQGLLQAIQQDLATLLDSSEALESEIEATHQAYRDWNDGTESLNELHMRMDRLYYETLNGSPLEPDLNALHELSRDFLNAMEEGQPTAFRIQQREEGRGLAGLMVTQVQHFASRLDMVRQITAGRRSEDDENRFTTIVQNFASIQRRLGELRQEDQLQDFRPATSQIDQWRQTLDGMSVRIGELESMGAPEEMLGELSARNNQLRNSLDQATRQIELEADHHRRYQSMRPHMYGFDEALRLGQQGNWRQRRDQATQALNHLQALNRLLSGAPDSFEQRFIRGLTNFREHLKEFISSPMLRPRPQWYQTVQAAIEVVRHLEPDYQAPQIRAPRVRRSQDDSATRAHRRQQRQRQISSEDRPTPNPPPPPPNRGGDDDVGI